MADFDASLTGSAKDGIFGLPFSAEEAKLHLLPVPWEVTTSYGGGTSRGPDAILNASPQIDLFDFDFGRAYEAGFFMHKSAQHLLELNDRLKPLAEGIKKDLEENHQLSQKSKEDLEKVNQGCEEMIDWVYKKAKSILDEGKLFGLIGGDHSSPEGGLRAISEKMAQMDSKNRGNHWALLHIDAHADLRNAYQGFKHSHASIMYNVMTSNWKPQHLVQVGIRDFSEEEFEFTQSRKDVRCFFDAQLKEQLYTGKNWGQLCQEILYGLPQNVYISFDIDGLSPDNCPNTGTPVPGGLSFDQAAFLIKALVHSGRKIIGFDLNEVAPSPDPENEWDGNIGARLLYKLCGWTVFSQNR